MWKDRFKLLATVGAVGSGGQKRYPLALWLVPAQEQRRRIQEIISGLAGDHSSSAHYIPVFQPHATLCVGELQNNDFAEGLRALFGQVDTFCASQKEISLAVRADQPIDQRKKQWSQFLFLALDQGGAPPEALDLRATRNSFPAISNLELSTDANDPQIPMLHVSLMYNGIENSFGGIAQEVTNKYKYDLPDQLVFESIQVVMPRSGDWRDILKEHPDANGNWDVIFNRKLHLQNHCVW